MDIPLEHIEWARKQAMFFVASAPLDQSGHVNCSPKGGDCFYINDKIFVYADYTGSGIETISHIKENRRICIMFCSFDKIPRILRFHGAGSVILKDNKEFDTYKSLIPLHKSIRAYIKVDITRFEKSCGYGVPIFEFKEHRKTLDKWAVQKSDEELKDYQVKENSFSIDRLEGI